MRILTEYTDYENNFVEICNERNWYVQKDEDETPILVPARKKDRGVYKVAMHGPGVVSLIIMAEHGKTKTALLNKAESANLQGEIYVEGDSEACYNFPLERLARAVKTFNLKRKQKHPGPPKEAIAKGQEALKKYREEQKKLRKT